MEAVIVLLTIIVPAALSYPAGSFMYLVLGKEIKFFSAFADRLTGNTRQRNQSWREYALSLLIFNIVMFAFAYLVLALQPHLPLNPDGKGVISPDLIFHTVSSFTTNTNLQHYSGEVTMSYFSQIFALMWLQFVSCATGISALAAVARGLGGKTSVGNFYEDLVKTVFFVLLPLAFLTALLLAAGGVVMTLQGCAYADTVEGIKQTIARGPVAAFVAIKQIGTNGGGFFGANSAHPFENPNLITNFIESLMILLLPMASVWMFGKITGKMRHAAVIFTVMALLLSAKISFALYFENGRTPAFTALAVEQTANLEGKELRFGKGAGALWSVITTATSNGSVNAMIESLNPLSALAPMAGMWLNAVFGGAGVGMINMTVYIIIAVFISGMMVGRTPEYMCKRVETKEMKIALITLLLHPLFILGGSALFASGLIEGVKTGVSGYHGFSEILYEFSSAAANNGSGFEGLPDNTVAWNIITGVIMIVSRYLPIILPLAIAGSLAEKKGTPESAGSLRTDTVLFGFVLLGTIIIVGALLFLPVAVLGPIAEHLSVTIHQ